MTLGVLARTTSRLGLPAVARGLLVLALLGLPAVGAHALHVIDFEQPYYVHPDWQVWDFCLVKWNTLYVLYYGAIPMDDPYPGSSDHIWYSTSGDLIHWSPPVQVLAVSSAPYESRALWAPDVVYDAGTHLWWMAYTGVDDASNQRICTAYSTDLVNWSKSPLNPVQEPAPPEFFYDPDGQWSECRDPYLYVEDGQWHMLTTVRTNDLPGGRAALAMATAITVHAWTDPEVFLLNGSATPTASLESSQYIVRQGVHHLLFHEYGTSGISHLAANEPGAWSFAARTIIDQGLAPEVDSFDGGQSWLLSRIAPFSEPHLGQLAFVVRTDTLRFGEGLAAPTVHRTPPLAREFAAFTGNSVLGNPTFGDNPKRRGEESVGLVGTCYFGSAEYFQGPLSGRGQPGQMLGEAATGSLRSHPFVITGLSMSLRVGGTDDPEHCYVALMDAATDTMIYRESGDGQTTMTERWWDLVPYDGREVYVAIVDAAVDGHINVDHIKETMTALAVEPTTAAAGLTDLGPRPNPGNPQVALQFTSSAATVGRATVYDLRGRRIWQTPAGPIAAGPNTLVWPGRDDRGLRAPGGVYLYRITTAEGAAITGKVTLAP
ncbi:MAG: FlgD immunoglobulin-like domain containing protein [Candidatus Krumholzibacteriia bacterium]